jgi:hypothetical protein
MWKDAEVGQDARIAVFLIDSAVECVVAIRETGNVLVFLDVATQLPRSSCIIQ